jgi:mannitol operon repressor
MSKFRSIDKTHPHLKEFTRLLDVAREESDRGAVLVHCSMLDELLKRTIEARLIIHSDVAKLTDGFNAPLGTFSSRILSALALGIISTREYDELELLRKIRNLFAHSIEASFRDQAITSRCKALTYAIKTEPDEPRPDARGQFLTSAACLTLNLVNRPHYVSLERLAHHDWQY